MIENYLNFIAGLDGENKALKNKLNDYGTSQPERQNHTLLKSMVSSNAIYGNVNERQ
jgi:hypothetical protein